MHTHSDPRVGNVSEKIAAHLDEIRSYFEPDTVVTLVVRSSSADDHSYDMIITSDKIPKVIAALQHHETAKDTQHATVMADD